MKKMLIDIYKINDLFSGLGQFSKNYASAILSSPLEGVKPTFLVPRRYASHHESVELKRDNFQSRYLPFLNGNYALWHSLHQLPSHLPANGTPWILTVHDLNFLVEKSPEKAEKYLARLQKNVDRATVITAISNFTKDALSSHVQLRGKPVKVIYNGVIPPTVPDLEKPKYIKRKKFFFAMSVFKEKKNFEVLLPLMTSFMDYQLVIAGNNSTGYGEKIKRMIDDLGLQDQVILPGKVSEEEKKWLYHHCEAFFSPSMAEGFGLPIIEAMLCGKQVFVSSYGSLPEVGGEAAMVWDKFESSYMAHIIHETLDANKKNEVLAKERIRNYAMKFTWDKCIGEYKAVYKSLLK